MAEQAEFAFVKAFANNLSSQPVTYTDDFQQPPSNSLKRVPVLQVELPAPPKRKYEESASGASSINVTFKSLKPAHSYTLSVQPTDTIASIKSQLASEPGAPPADVQRLLLKGKAFADGKLLKEYDIKDGDTINLMVKPGFHWDPSKVASPAPVEEKPETITLVPEPKESKSRHGHSRIPSVVLSPSPSLIPSPGEKLVDIPLTLDTPSGSVNVPESSYHATISQPVFWDRLHAFLTAEFPNRSDVATAWEDFFCASKGTLSVSEIAKIRDKVGVIGMAGT